MGTSWGTMKLKLFKFIKFKSLKSRAGFSYIEVLVCMGLSSIAAFAMMDLTVLSTSKFSYQKNAVNGLNVAESVAEDLAMVLPGDTYLKSSSELPFGTPYPHKRYFLANGVETDAANKVFTASWRVTVDSPLVGLRTIDIDTIWYEGQVAKKIKLRVIR